MAAPDASVYGFVQEALVDNFEIEAVLFLAAVGMCIAHAYGSPQCTRERGGGEVCRHPESGDGCPFAGTRLRCCRSDQGQQLELQQLRAKFNVNLDDALFQGLATLK